MAKTGKIIIDIKKPAMECDVVDISAGGAHLAVHGTEAIPQRFTFLYGGSKKLARAVWIKGRRVGVQF
jgi:hypothetical protein